MKNWFFLSIKIFIFHLYFRKQPLDAGLKTRLSFNRENNLKRKIVSKIDHFEFGDGLWFKNKKKKKNEWSA